MNDQDAEPPSAGRRHPTHGIRGKPGDSVIVFLTACTKDRRPWLACDSVHRTLRQIWKEEATDWRVGRYVIMPDHLHLFTTPSQPGTTLEKWVTFWKARSSLILKRQDWVWQTDHWDRRLRSGQIYAQKWEYIQQNPVRKGLVSRAEDWPYQGEIFSYSWA